MKKWKVSDFKTFYRDVVVPKYLKKRTITLQKQELSD